MARDIDDQDFAGDGVGDDFAELDARDPVNRAVNEIRGDGFANQGADIPSDKDGGTVGGADIEGDDGSADPWAPDRR